MLFRLVRFRALIAVALILVATGLIVTFAPGGGSLDLDVDRRAGSTAAGDDSTVPRELESLRALYRTVNLVQKHYLDASRIDPRAMLVAGMRAVQDEVPKLMLREEPDRLVVRVDRGERAFALGDVTTPWALLSRTKDIFAWLKQGLSADGADFQELEYTLINGMLSTLDPHSALLLPDIYRDMKDKTQGQFGGLGIVISIRDGVLTVISPIDGTPAALAGMQAGDQIVKIDETSTVNLPLNEAVDLLRGPPGTKVSVFVLRKGWDEPRRFDMVRAIVEVKSVESHLLGAKVGYVRIKDFQGNTGKDLDDHLARLRAQGMRGLVLDLRNNPGGLLDAAVDVADRFLDEGVIVTTAGQGPAERDVRRADADGHEWTGPLVVLINAGSASASEIVAGALKNHDRALVLGQRSFGKGSVQVLYDYQDGAALKLTTAQYLTPGDLSIQSVGVTPHVELVPLRADEDMIDLAGGDPWRESDLERHFTGARTEVAALNSLPYLWTPPAAERGDAEDDDDAAPTPPIALDPKRPFEPDLEIQLAAQLLPAAPGPAAPLDPAALSRLVAQIEARQSVELVESLKKLGIDWRLDGDAQPARLEVQVAAPRGGAVLAGENLTLEVTVTNHGPGKVSQLRAETRSDFRAADDRELVFGRLGAGETVTRRLEVKIPRDSLARVDDVRLTFFEARDRIPAATAVRFGVEARPRPSFVFTRWFDDRRGGDGDGRAEPGETIDLFLTVENRGPGPAGEPLISLKNLSSKELFIERGRATLEELVAGAQREERFSFQLRPGFAEEQAQLELSVVDLALREVVTEKILLPVATTRATAGAGAPGPETELGRRVTVFAPRVDLAPFAPVTRDERLILKGLTSDDVGITDVYVYSGANKVFFAPNSAPDRRRQEFSVEAPLSLGLNWIVVVAEEGSGLETKRFVAVRRDAVDGQAFVASRRSEKESEPLGVVPLRLPARP